jgi:hypothetical protein
MMIMKSMIEMNWTEASINTTIRSRVTLDVAAERDSELPLPDEISPVARIDVSWAVSAGPQWCVSAAAGLDRTRGGVDVSAVRPFAKDPSSSPLEAAANSPASPK